MRQLLAVATVALASAALVVAGCAVSTPSAAPTTAAAPQSKAVEATKAPTSTVKTETAQPSPAPAKKTDYPVKGRTVTMICPFAAGGGGDNAARVLAASLEKELGVPIQVLNKAGAGGQVGHAELANAKPDGYTLLYSSMPQNIGVYLDPERKAGYDRQSFTAIAMHAYDPDAITVKGDSKYKTVKDLVDAAKASPEKIKFAVMGRGDPSHLALIQLEQAAGVKFASVIIDGGAPCITALMGGHVDAICTAISPQLPQIKAEELRPLALLQEDKNPFAPDVPTMKSQGYNINWAIYRSVMAPAGVPKDVVDVLNGAIKRAMETEDHKKRLQDMSQLPFFMDSERFSAYWDQMEATMKPMMDLIK